MHKKVKVVQKYLIITYNTLEIMNKGKPNSTQRNIIKSPTYLVCGSLQQQPKPCKPNPAGAFQKSICIHQHPAELRMRMSN